MKIARMGMTVLVACGLALLPACSADSSGDATEAAAGPVVKGGDDRTGEYDPVPGWWKPAPDHVEPWGWGQVSGMAVDSPDRIIVGIWGDRDAQGNEREGSTNYVVAVDRDGNITENWSRWDSIFNKPHQLYISPYDPERHVWVVERGGGRDVNMQVLKFSNDGSELVMRLVDRDHPRTREEARANPHPDPYEYGDPAVMAFLPNGDFLLGDGYWHSRIIRYNAEGEYLMEWGELGSGPGQFDLIHGLAVDRNRRVYVGDRTNNRIQIFSEDGEYIEEWPDVSDPVGVFIDENDAVWVVSAMLNRITQVQHGRRTPVLCGRVRGHPWRLPGRPVASAPDRRGPGGQPLYRELGRRLDGQVHAQAGRRTRASSWAGGWFWTTRNQGCMGHSAGCPEGLDRDEQGLGVTTA